MNIHSGSRGSGKTTKALEWLHLAPGGVLVVLNSQRRDMALMEYDAQYGKLEEGKQIITAQQFTTGTLRGRRPEGGRPLPMCFDEADEVLRHILLQFAYVELEKMTLTPDYLK